ncbi:MAG: CYTH domain-containing protein [Hyphomicrobiales bacterium]
MAKEIERKFLVKNNDFKLNAKRVYLHQGYLHIDENKVVRIRVSNDSAWVCIKSSSNGITRDEYEYTIPKVDAEEMLRDLCIKPTVEKYRYFKEIGNHLWEVDEFLGDNQGLIVAEIELQSEDEIFERPDWIDKEVSQDKRYFNAYLSKNPYKHW